MPGPKLVFISTNLHDPNKARIELDGDFDPDTNPEEGIQEGDYVVVTDEETIINIKDDPRFNQQPADEISFSAPVFMSAKLEELNIAFKKTVLRLYDDGYSEEIHKMRISRVDNIIIIEAERLNKDDVDCSTLLDLEDADYTTDSNGQPIFPVFAENVLALK